MPASGSKPSNSKPGNKTVCPISRDAFTAGAQPITLRIGNTEVVLEPWQFSTGSFGYFANPKVVVEVAGKRVTCQANLSLIVVGSKEAPK
jgi:hypothetical protein